MIEYFKRICQIITNYDLKSLVRKYINKVYLSHSAIYVRGLSEPLLGTDGNGTKIITKLK